ncbi:MAG: class I SAM-dependent methyltransferase [Anaerolineae bacterium]|nr:class I SAM-dependent methyltransferase [Anaerolineae bacterium]MCA9908283.1 class I SAM-dependent methyltransferase [Anaerolineae bacterium]
MTSLLPPLTGRTVLDLACGSGRYADIALVQGAAQVIGIDNSPHMLAQAQFQNRILATFSPIPLASQSIDVVVCGLALGHVPDLEAAFAEIARVLKAGGVALISDVHPFLFLGGAQRTFTVDGQTLAVEHHVHLYADYQRTASAAGLFIDRILEPRLLSEDTQARLSAPVAIVYRMTKP